MATPPPQYIWQMAYYMVIWSDMLGSQVISGLMNSFGTHFLHSVSNWDSNEDIPYCTNQLKRCLVYHTRELPILNYLSDFLELSKFVPISYTFDSC